MTFTATVTSKGQIVIPLPIRRLLHLEPSSVLEFRVEDQEVVLAKVMPLEDGLGMLNPSKKGFSEQDYREAIWNAVIEKSKSKKE